MSDNPYQSPPSDDADAINAKAIVRTPAICLIVLALLTVLLDIPIGFVNFVDTMRFMEAYGFAAASPLGLGTIFVILMHFIVLVGAIQMYRLRSYRLAKGAAIVSLVPFCSPGFVLGIPFGIWAIVALSKNGVREAFTARSHK